MPISKPLVASATDRYLHLNVSYKHKSTIYHVHIHTEFIYTYCIDIYNVFG